MNKNFIWIVVGAILVGLAIYEWRKKSGSALHNINAQATDAGNSDSLPSC